MEIIPAIDIRGGRCVRLYQGDYDQETVYAEDPVAVAEHWAMLGATRLHVVDLDGARTGEPVNRETVARIIRAVRVPVQVGGGVRDMETFRSYVELGAARVILGTAVVRDPRLAGEASWRFPGAAVVSIDARNGVVAVQGWTETTHERADWLMRDLASRGVPRFIYTDISRDGTLESPNFEVYRSLVEKVPAAIIAAGGVGSVAHLVRLAETGVEAAVVGRALYTGDVALEEALQAVEEAASGR
ncbi:MAG TPA: 1-(5-phosphoribosyl)-5-[(5-phosphoribosylamino)methylideneamino]imidazole-4-carboxamide isomerase [Dehalococcoidia bacterium]